MRPVMVLFIPANKRDKCEDVITTMPGLVVLALDTDRAVVLLEAINSRFIKESVLSTNVSAPSPFIYSL